MKIGDLTIRHVVLVTKTLTHDCLLGADFLTAHGCVVDLQRNVVLIAVKAVPLACKSNADENRVRHVTVADTVQVPASCELHISSRVATNPREVLSGDVLFEQRKDFIESHGLAVAHAVMQTRNDLIVVQVLNPHRMPVVLRKGEKIGCLKPLQDVCGIELIDEKGQKNSQRRQALEDAIDQLVSAAKNISDSDKRKLRDLLSQFGDVISTGDRIWEKPAWYSIQLTQGIQCLYARQLEDFHTLNVMRYVNY